MARTGRGSAVRVLPVLYLHLGIAPGKFRIYGEVDGVDLGSNRYVEWVAGLRIVFDRKWEVGVAYRRKDWSVQTSGFLNHFQSETAVVGIGYRW